MISKTTTIGRTTTFQTHQLQHQLRHLKHLQMLQLQHQQKHPQTPQLQHQQKHPQTPQLQHQHAPPQSLTYLFSRWSRSLNHSLTDAFAHSAHSLIPFLDSSSHSACSLNSHPLPLALTLLYLPSPPLTSPPSTPPSLPSLS